MRVIKHFPIYFFILLFTGCISTYKSIKPEKLAYNPPVQNDSISYAFNYNVLELSHNRKLEKKTERRNIMIVAAEITNRTNKTLNLGKDVLLKSGNSLINILSPEYVGRQIHRVVPPYMTYFMLYLYQQEINCEGSNREIYPIGLPIIIGRVMMITNSNKKFLKQLRQYNYFTTWINPQETKHVLISFKADKEFPLECFMKDSVSFEFNDTLYIKQDR